MQRGAAIAQSIAFHGLVVAVLVIGVPHLGHDIAPEQPVLTVNFVDVAPETNLDEGIEQEAKPSDTAPEEPESQEAETPPPAPPPAPPSPQAPEAAEAVPAPSSGESAPEKKPEQTQEAKKAEVKAPPKRPQSAATQKREQQQAALTSKLQDLTKRETPAQRRNKGADEAKDKLAEILKKNQDSTDDADEETKVEESIEQLIGQALNTPRRTDSALGVSVLDKLRNHIANCWSPPPGAAGADSLIVDIIVSLNAKAEVQGVEIVDERKFTRDNVFRAAANAARRAILDCSPLPLPLDSYEDWKEIRFEFNPRFITRR